MRDEGSSIEGAYDFDPNEAPPHERPDGLPSGFRVKRDGIYRRISAAKEGDDPWTWLCSPIRVVSLPRDKHGVGWGRLVILRDPDGVEHRWSIPMRLFAGDAREVVSGLLDRGFAMNRDQASRAAVLDFLTKWTPKARARTTERLGWSDENCRAFVLGDGRVIGDETIIFQNESAPPVAAELHGAGTLDGWRGGVSALCIGNPILITAVSLAFSGPLLELLGLDGGGIHLRGQSSRGKTSAQKVAVSVWGSPRALHTWRATSNGLEGVACISNGSLLALDELSEISGKDAGQAVYMLANGQVKARAKSSGAARARPRWKVPILSSGEISLADKVAEFGGRSTAGQAVRLLDVQADDYEHGAFAELHGYESGAAFSDAIRAATARNYGVAGPAFVEAILGTRDACLAELRDAMQRFEVEASERFGLGAEGQLARAAQRFALIAAAGELATAFGLTGWASGAAIAAAFEIFERWFRARGGAGPIEARDAVQRLRSFISKHGNSRFEPLKRRRRNDYYGDDASSDHEPARIINQAGWVDEQHFYISTDAWREEVHKGADAKRAARHLADAGLLTEGGERDSLQFRLTLKGGERPRAYAIKRAIVEAGDD